MYLKELKRTGRVYAELLTESQVSSLKSNPHTSKQFSFIPVPETIAVEKQQKPIGDTSAQKVKKADRKITEINQENESESRSGASEPLQENA